MRSSSRVLSPGGESSRQNELTQLTGRRGSEAIKLDGVDLELVCEPENPHDPLAVKVLVRGFTSGTSQEATPARPMRLRLSAAHTSR